MRQEVTAVDLLDVEWVKVVCERCGVAVEVPVSKPEAVPAKCLGCGEALPVHALTFFLRSARDLLQTLKATDSTINCSVIIEAVE